MTFNKKKASAYLTAVAIFVAIGIFNALPIYRPLLVETTPEREAQALIWEGNCDEGVAIFEKLAQNGLQSAYRDIAEGYWWGYCGGEPDLKEVVFYLRKGAAMGDCKANLQLAILAEASPDIEGIEHVPPENNFLAASLCNDYWDDGLKSGFYDEILGDEVSRAYPVFGARLPESYFHARKEKERLKHAKPEEIDALTLQIETGRGYDKNPTPRYEFEPFKIR